MIPIYEGDEGVDRAPDVVIYGAIEDCVATLIVENGIGNLAPLAR